MELAQRIEEFEKQYLARLHHWCALLPEEDLENLLIFLPKMEAESESITQAFEAHEEVLYTNKWKPILDRVSCLIPSLIAQLEKMKRDARINMNQLGKGQKGLHGYRYALPIQKTFFEREG